MPERLASPLAGRHDLHRWLADCTPNTFETRPSRRACRISATDLARTSSLRCSSKNRSELGPGTGTGSRRHRTLQQSTSIQSTPPAVGRPPICIAATGRPQPAIAGGISQTAVLAFAQRSSRQSRRFHALPTRHRSRPSGRRCRADRASGGPHPDRLDRDGRTGPEPRAGGVDRGGLARRGHRCEGVWPRQRRDRHRDVGRDDLPDRLAHQAVHCARHHAARRTGEDRPRRGDHQVPPRLSHPGPQGHHPPPAHPYLGDPQLHRARPQGLERDLPARADQRPDDRAVQGPAIRFQPRRAVQLLQLGVLPPRRRHRESLRPPLPEVSEGADPRAPRPPVNVLLRQPGDRTAPFARLRTQRHRRRELRADQHDHAGRRWGDLFHGAGPGGLAAGIQRGQTDQAGLP